MDWIKKSSFQGKQELKAIGISLLFLILGFLVIWFIKEQIKIDKDAIYVSLLLIPIIVYTIISGRLKVFKGPGGLEAHFTETALKSNRPDSPCHKDVEQDWRQWIENESFDGSISNIVDAILKFQKSILIKGCPDYDYSLELKGLGRFTTTVLENKKDTSTKENNSIVKEIHTTLEIGDQGIHNTWKADKIDDKDHWEITLII